MVIWSRGYLCRLMTACILPVSCGFNRLVGLCFTSLPGAEVNCVSNVLMSNSAGWTEELHWERRPHTSTAYTAESMLVIVYTEQLLLLGNVHVYSTRLQFNRKGKQKEKSPDRLHKGAKKTWLKANPIYTVNNNKHKHGHINGGGQFQLFPFFSDVCSGWARLAPQFGTRLKFPHSEMRPGHRLKLFHVVRWNERIGWEAAWAPSLLVRFHSPLAYWRGKVELKKWRKWHLFLFFPWSQ